MTKPMGDPQLLNEAGWLRDTVEACLRRTAAQTAFGHPIMPFAADLLDEIDRLRALVKETIPWLVAFRPYTEVPYNIEKVIAQCDIALANTRAQE